MTSDRSLFAVSVTVPDRVGVLRDVTKAILELQGNLVDLRQVVVGGCFSLTCIATLPAGTDAEALRSAIDAQMAPDEAGILVRPYVPAPGPVVARGARYVFTISGPDAPGRVFEASQFFVERGINIEDWQHIAATPGTAFNVGLVTIPDDLDLQRVQKEFVRRLTPLGLSARLLHENIFRATNEIGPIHALLPHAPAPR
jgi:predicted amino acid-binding ACT domain protein